jgi:hypothetical protein
MRSSSETNLDQKRSLQISRGGKLRRFGHGSKAVDRMMSQRARDEPTPPRRRQMIDRIAAPA